MSWKGIKAIQMAKKNIMEKNAKERNGKERKNITGRNFMDAFRGETSNKGKRSQNNDICDFSKIVKRGKKQDVSNT